MFWKAVSLALGFALAAGCSGADFQSADSGASAPGDKDRQKLDTQQSTGPKEHVDANKGTDSGDGDGDSGADSKADSDQGGAGGSGDDNDDDGRAKTATELSRECKSKGGNWQTRREQCITCDGSYVFDAASETCSSSDWAGGAPSGSTATASKGPSFDAAQAATSVIPLLKNFGGGAKNGGNNKGRFGPGGGNDFGPSNFGPSNNDGPSDFGPQQGGGGCGC